ncbi:uncharacterized protein PFLUO_LOCUS5816 [Penicillium psychrofluorescens]|uniref:uncharacterized protein n=1 Tax=Penicillium psychrofluorescens TaxID=3158075 RepID=UPI003CCCBBC9
MEALDEEQVLALIVQIKDWQVNHGSLLKLIRRESVHSSVAHPVGVAVVPSAFPRSHFQHALDLQQTYNELYCAVAEDAQWIGDTIRDLIPVEPLAAALWGIYEAAAAAGPVQHISAGIFRSDYMLHRGQASATTLKQVEFNAFSCSGAAHANKVADMHRYLTRTGAYRARGDDTDSIDLASLPQNKNIRSLAACLATAHAAYGPRKCPQATHTAVLFVVQPYNFNIADERPIEYALWEQETPVPTYRLDFGPEVLEHTWLTASRELLFHPPWLGLKAPVEISVVYMRAGYEAREYNAIGWEARLQLEKSAAIKCPSLLSHLSTFKKVQQALTIPGTLERFLQDDKAAAVRETFVSVFPLDNSEAGTHAQQLATDPERSEGYILKPSLEGGGHNIFGSAIPGFLASIPQSTWSSYVLMERIDSPHGMNILMGPAGVEGGEVVSELGVLGSCLWRAPDAPGSQYTLLSNSVAGWTFKTKHADIDEMSVVKGFGCFDTPHLVGDTNVQ